MVEHFLLAPSKQALRYRVLVVKSIHYMPDLQDMAVVVGFEPTDGSSPPTVFKTVTLNHSVTLP